jgi:hypothetical protein
MKMLVSVPALALIGVMLTLAHVEGEQGRQGGATPPVQRYAAEARNMTS